MYGKAHFSASWRYMYITQAHYTSSDAEHCVECGSYVDSLKYKEATKVGAPCFYELG